MFCANTMVKAGLKRLCVEIWASLTGKAKFCPTKHTELKFRGENNFSEKENAKSHFHFKPDSVRC